GVQKCEASSNLGNRCKGQRRGGKYRQGAKVITCFVAPSAQVVEIQTNLFQIAVRGIEEAQANAGMHIVTAREGESPAEQRLAAFQKQRVIRVDDGPTPVKR